jgi:hypothetical protein
VGSIDARLSRLEESDREHALNELRHAWSLLSDEEIALIVLPFEDATRLPDGSISGVRVLTSQEEQAARKAKAHISEEMITRAIGLTDQIPEEEIDRRIKVFVRRLGVIERGEGIRRHMKALRKEGRR